MVEDILVPLVKEADYDRVRSQGHPELMISHHRHNVSELDPVVLGCVPAHAEHDHSFVDVSWQEKCLWPL